MIRKDLGDIRALTLIRVVLERTENEELRNQLEEYLRGCNLNCVKACS